MANPVNIKKSTTLSLRVNGFYTGECMIETEDGDMVDFMVLMEMFKGKEVKVSVRSVEEEDWPKYVIKLLNNDRTWEMSIVCFTIEVEPTTISRNKIKANWGSRKDYPLFLFIKLNF